MPTPIQEQLVLNWLEEKLLPGVPLFKTTDDAALKVELFLHGKKNPKNMFRRHPAMDARVRELSRYLTVENANAPYCGTLYCMFRRNRVALNQTVEPLYVGIAQWRNRDGSGISANFKGVASGGGNSAFMRWGYGNFWHFGQMFNAAFRGIDKHANWIAELFEEPPRLKAPVFWWGIPWPCRGRDWTGTERTLEEIEGELIKSLGHRLLNKQKGAVGCRCFNAGLSVNHPCGLH